MNANIKSYPYPVLGNEDDIKGIFNIDFKYELSKDNVVLNVISKLQNGALADLVKKERASFVVEVECRNSFYRTSLSTRNTAEKWIIPSRFLRERVAVSFYICADEDIKNYVPSDCHPDYKGLSFEIEKGDVLAFGGGCSFVAEKGFDPLRPPVSSLMSIREGRRHEGPMGVDYGSDKITVELSKSDWKNYLEIKKHTLAVGALHASVVLPVLIDAIYQAQEASSEYKDNNWYGRLESILDAKGLRDREPLEAAQRILDNPCSRNFKSIDLMLDITSDKE